jgi:hypothetical protein
MSATRFQCCLLLLILVLAGCGGRSASGRPGVQRNLLTTQDLEGGGYRDALTTVQSLRPQWLNSRGVSSFTQRETVKVYLDGSLLGGPETLAQIPIHSIASMRYLDALEATNRWGLDHGLGAIMVSTRRSPDAA